MFLVVGSFLILALIITGAALVLFGGYRFGDLLVLAILSGAAVYLSRFNAYLSLTVQNRTFSTLFWLFMALALFLLVVRLFVPNRTPLRCGLLFFLFAAFGFLSIVSGVFNGGVEGLIASVHVLGLVFAPILVGWLLVDIMPRDQLSSRRMRLSFILILGVLTSMIVLVSSLAPNLLGSLLGWSEIAASRAFGFVRGWSPIGSAPATGLLLVLAYGLAMHEVIDNRRRIFIPVLILVGLAIMFMLTRSVLLMFLLFHLFYFWSALRRNPLRVIGLALLAGIIMTPIMLELFERFSFERFTSTQDSSIDIRTSSAIAALEASFEKPFLGHGPGLLYEQIRTEGVGMADALGGRHMYVGQHISALEPHDLYLMLAAEHGLPAAGFFIAAMLVLWSRARTVRIPPLHRRSPLSVTLSALWISAFAMYLTSSGPLVNPQASLFFWFFAFYGLHWRATLNSIEHLGSIPHPRFVDRTFKGILQPAP
jgi:hypothetical protein